MTHAPRRRLAFAALAAAAALAGSACKREDAKPATDEAKPAAGGAKPAAKAGAASTVAPAAGKKLMAKIATDKGDITCELFHDKAPKTVASFVELARGTRPWKDPLGGGQKSGTPFFDGLAFHRVIPTFMIQGGDPLSRSYERGDIGSGGPGYDLPDEIVADLKFDVPGRLAMANAGPNTGGSQFFITEVPRQQLDGGYTIFGQCDAPDVVQAIARVPVDSPDHNKPLVPVTMRVEIFER